MSLLSNIASGWLGRQLGLNDAPQEYAQPIGPGMTDVSGDGYLGGRPNFGLLSPQVVPFDQYNQDRHSFSGIMGALTGGRPGLGSALGQAFAPDSFSVPGYNAQLAQGQGVEANRLQFPQKQIMADAISGAIDSNGNRVRSGESQFGELPGQGQMPSNPYDAPPSPPPVTADNGMVFGGSAGGLFDPSYAPGAPASSGGPGAAATPSMPAAQPASGGKINRLWGIPTADNMSPQMALLNQITQPNVYKEYTAAQWAPARGDSYHVGADGQQHYMPAAKEGVAATPEAPLGSPAYQERIRQFNQQKVIDEQNARVAAERQILGTKFTLNTGEPPPGGGGGPAPAPAAARNPAPSMTAPAASTPAKAAQFASSPAAAVMTGKDLLTDKGTIVPNPQGLQNLGKGETEITNNLNASNKTTEGWSAIKSTLETTRARLLLTADIFKNLEGKGLNEQKAEASNWLHGAGLDWFANKVMKADDVAGVQMASWNAVQEVLGQLKTATAGSKMLNSEFVQSMDRAMSPDLHGKALHEATAQMLGNTYQMQNMIRDYDSKGRALNWRDANQFQSAYLDKNPIEGFTNYARNDIGPFRGMAGNTGASAKMAMPGGPAAQAAPSKSGLKTFASPSDPNLQMLPRGTHFLDANGVERIRP